MEVRLSSRRTEITPRLEEYSREKVERLDRFVAGLDHAEVHFFEEGTSSREDSVTCEITLQGHGHHVRAKHTTGDGFSALDGTIAKLERQLRKLKTRLIRRWHKGGAEARKLAEAGFIEPAANEELTEIPKKRLVKSKKFYIDSMTPEEALEELELVNHDFYFFHNSETERAAIVYRRDDGDYGIIDEAG